MNSTIATHKKCVLCKRSDRKLRRIPNRAIFNCFLKTNILIQFKCRACSNHFTENYLLSDESIKSLKADSISLNMTSENIKLVFDFLRFSSIRNSIFDKFNSSWLFRMSSVQV